MKQAKYSLNLFTIVLFVILNIVSSATLTRGDTQKPDQPTSEQRKYSPMSAEEAAQLVRKHIKDVEPGPLSSWKLPETVAAQGIKINDNDYVIFAHTEQNEVCSFPIKPLWKLIEKTPLEKNPPAMIFFLNEIMFSTVDLEVVNNPTFTRSEELSWNRAKQVIEKGGYKWFIGAVGILLRNGGSKTLIISFEEPIIDISFKEPSLYEVALSISPGEHPGILVKVAGQVIQLK